MLVPMALPANPSWHDPRHFRLLRVLVRRKPGVSLSALQKELVSDIQATAAEEPAQFVTMRKDMEIRVTPLRQWLTGNVRTAVLVLQGAVAMVLLIACLNIASLQVARAIARKKEIAVRAAIGASGARLVRQLLTENLLVCGCAGLAGLLLGSLSLGALRTFLPANLHLADTLHLDAPVLAYTLAITLAAGLLTGFVPALAALRIGLNDTLKEEGRGTGSRGQHRMRGALVVVEIGAAMVLLIGASVLIRTFAKLASTALGFEPQGVLTLKVAASPRRYPTSEKVVAFYAAVLANAQAIPGVDVAAVGDGLPLVGNAGAAGISFEGRPAPPVGGRPSLPAAGISANYFRALRIPLLRGRLFRENEKAAVINQAFAQEFYPTEDPLGKRISIGSQNQWREIVGIVGTVKQKGRRPVDPFAIYFPFQETVAPETFLVLKSKLPPAVLVAAAAKAVQAVDPSQPIFDVATMEDRLHESLSAQRANMTLMAAFAALALSLATVGIFGVIAYFVNSRVQEIAIRMALGASSQSVVRMVLGHAMMLAALGIAAGIGAALILTRPMGSLIEGIRTNDPLSFASTSLLFACIAALACSIPARRAARVDPMTALRHG
jgi:putative ABC transport system permease protein